ncbi:uncharacterized protein [Haliotis asinina]|uniref:uncharacterized protein n=1 Tax=Haliotis asinina TaxID=109174 RepID=UPI003531CAB0
MVASIMARLLYAVAGMTLLFAISVGKRVLKVTTQLLHTRRLQYTEHNLPSIQNKEIALSVECCSEVTICFSSQADVNIRQNMFAVTLSTRGISMKLGHSIHSLKQEYMFQHRIDMCRRRSVFVFSWKENMMTIFKDCNTHIFNRKLPWTGTIYSVKFITVTSKALARWSYGDVCDGKHFAPHLPENTGIKEFHTSKTTGYLPLTPKSINVSAPFAFSVKGCGKLALMLHRTRWVLPFVYQYKVEIDNRAGLIKASIIKGIGPPFKSVENISKVFIPDEKPCNDFRTFRVNYSQNHLEFGGCDGMSERLLNWSSPDLHLYIYMSIFSENHADWSFGAKYQCGSKNGPVTALLPKPSLSCNHGYVLKGSSCVAACDVDADCSILLMQRCCRGVCSSKCSRTVPGMAGSVRGECSPGSQACTKSAVNRQAETSSMSTGNISNKPTGHMTTILPHALVTRASDDVIDVAKTNMPGLSPSASSSSSNSSSNSSTSGNSSSVTEQFQEGIEQISKALGSSGIDLVSFTVNKLTILACICAFAT